MKIWKEQDYSGWRYFVEVRGWHYAVSDVEVLKKTRDEIASGKTLMNITLGNVLSRQGFPYLRFRLHEAYLIFRYRNEFINALDQAYVRFSKE